MQVKQLLQVAKENGLAPPLGAPTNYAELTLGGVLSASGHGTGFNVTSSLVRERRAVVEGFEVVCALWRAGLHRTRFRIAGKHPLQLTWSSCFKSHLPDNSAHTSALIA